MCMNLPPGIPGDSNVKCVIVASGAVGSRCAADGDCQYGLCTSSKCASPTLQCPTDTVGELCITFNSGACSPHMASSLDSNHNILIPAVPFLIVLHSAGSTCSQNGACRYTDPSGNIFASCKMSDVHCTAICQCNTGYGGRACSLSTTSLNAKSSLR